MSETWNDLAELASYKPNSENNTNLLIVDGNNLGYRYLQRKNFNSFREDYVRTVESLAKSYQCKDIIVAYDFGKSQYRLSHCPEYKANRIKPQDPDEKLHYDQFFAELNKTQEELPFQNFKLYGVEADDIIAYTVQKLRNRYPHIWVISSDRDLYQLLHTNVSIFNLFSRKEINLDYLYNDVGLTLDEFILAKIIQGDPGDNVKGIAGIGEKRSADLAKTHQKIETLLAKLPLPGKSQYIRNLNEGKEILLRNEKIINLNRHVREIISFGEKGEEYLNILNSWLDPIVESYPLHNIPEPVFKSRNNPVDIKSLVGLQGSTV